MESSATNEQPAESLPAPSAELVFYSSGTVDASRNPQIMYSSSPLLWGAQAMTYGSKLSRNPIFAQAAPAAPILSLGETTENLERAAKFLDDDPTNRDKGASGSDTCKESGGDDSSKTSRDDISLTSKIGNMSGQKKRVREAFRGMQNQHEDKRQKRKQSNRESARRSRERRQKECEILGRQVEDLSSHNADLRSEIDRLHAECERVGAENASITEELKKLHGPAVLTALGVD